ncbi:MAG: aminotransferase class V-fold PLP-dependent enzyme, partial [Candidatus Eisenbacteria bacterium]|nr:aminotransferase class V-fold PLP-dependent enzyme [Candidatus Eisenbacteria bacterium]
MERGLSSLREGTRSIVQKFIDGLCSIPAVTVYGTRDAARQSSAISFNILGKPCSEVGLRLDEEFGICCRVGLHCSPAAHRTIGTFPEGAVRFAPSHFTTEEEVGAALKAVERLAQE